MIPPVAAGEGIPKVDFPFYGLQGVLTYRDARLSGRFTYRDDLTVDVVFWQKYCNCHA